jgi:two-component system CitB family sensor kinase
VSLQCGISNLIANAVEAIQGQGLSQGQVLVSVRQDQDQVIFEVEDNGRGIPQRILPMVTDYGFTANKPNGKGIGLWQVREALEAVGGEIWIESSEGKGTKIVVKLPAIDERASVVRAL